MKRQPIAIAIMVVTFGIAMVIILAMIAMIIARAINVKITIEIS